MGRQNRYNRNHKSSAKKERIVMVASSVFVLAALTMTGVYVKSNTQKNQNDGYHIDFSALEEETEKLEIPELTRDNIAEDPMADDALDYLPLEQVDSGIVQIPGLTEQVSETTIGGPVLDEQIDQETLLDEVLPDELSEEVNLEAEANVEEEVAEKTDVQSSAAQRSPEFATGDKLVWPLTGSVLIPYSMDKTVYFSTLQQYKYNPAMIVAAMEGDDISAAVGGTVTEVFYDEEIGDAVIVDIGKGYEVTYGQLKDITVAVGDYVEKGEIIGVVAPPTKYYSIEGANAYFALTLNGEAVDPMGPLE